LSADYLTIENVQLLKGQHVQIVNRINNEYCMVQLVNSADGHLVSQLPKQIIEVQVPIALIKTKNKLNVEGKN
jgi:hypothetical protein